MSSCRFLDFIGRYREFRPAFPALLLFGLVTVLSPAPANAIYVPCGDADGSGVVTTADALAALRSSVGLPSPCDGNCDCDVDANREMTTSDALAVLHAAVTQESLSCGFYDGCFYDEDCEEGYECGTDPEWSCDAACVTF